MSEQASSKKSMEDFCTERPTVTPEDIVEESISFFDGDEVYARSLSFHASGRNFEILDRDLDGVADHLFSFGNGRPWCMDHNQLPKRTIRYAKEHLGLNEDDIKVPTELKMETNNR